MAHVGMVGRIEITENEAHFGFDNTACAMGIGGVAGRY
jgi:hypothetical protein